jgi:Zn-dependent oligopeptidase
MIGLDNIFPISHSSFPVCGRLFWEKNDLFDFHISLSELEALTFELGKLLQNTFDSIAILCGQERNFGNTFDFLSRFNLCFDRVTGSLSFISFSANLDVRNAFRSALGKLGEQNDHSKGRHDVFLVLLDVGKGLSKGSIQERVANVILDEFRRAGAEMNETSLKDLQFCRGELSKLSRQLWENLTWDVPTLFFDKKDLEGCSEEFLQGLDVAEEKVCVKLTNAAWVHMSEHVSCEEVRKRIDIAGFARGSANRDLFPKLFDTRLKIANLCGYPSWTDYRAAVMMVGNSSEILNFIERMKLMCQSECKNDIEKMLKVVPNKELRIWNAGYSRRLVKETHTSVNLEALRVHFEEEQVIENILSLFSNFLGLKFVSNSIKSRDDIELTGFDCFDANTGKTLGKIFFDLQERAGKQPGCACMTLSRKVMLADEVIPGLFCVQASFKGKFLSFKEVELLFHEVGHASNLIGPFYLLLLLFFLVNIY